MSSDESDESDEEESYRLGSESGLDGMLVIKLGVLLHDIGLPLGVTLSTDESCDGDRGSLVP